MKSSDSVKKAKAGALEKGRNNSVSSREDAFAYVPVKNRDVVETRLESGDLILEYPATVRPFVAKIMKGIGRKAPPVYTKRLQLDTLGTATWDMIDGKRTVGRLVKIFAEQYRLHPKEAETSVTQFIRELGRRGLIGLS
ncbi:MAG: PqqD family protein [Desulfatibacillum sp.]|nr:PqqD family protein [Desulfatibacillum sp.]